MFKLPQSSRVIMHAVLLSLIYLYGQGDIGSWLETAYKWLVAGTTVVVVCLIALISLADVPVDKAKEAIIKLIKEEPTPVYDVVMSTIIAGAVFLFMAKETAFLLMFAHITSKQFVSVSYKRYLRTIMGSAIERDPKKQ